MSPMSRMSPWLQNIIVIVFNPEILPNCRAERIFLRSRTPLLFISARGHWGHSYTLPGFGLRIYFEQKFFDSYLKKLVILSCFRGASDRDEQKTQFRSFRESSGYFEKLESSLTAHNAQLQKNYASVLKTSQIWPIISFVYNVLLHCNGVLC